MTTGLDRLVEILTLEQTGPDSFIGVGSVDDGVDATYGGHFVGQSVAAALATVESDRHLHSLHGYFLRAGRPGEPFRLKVDRVRDGRSFCSRRVQVFQDDDRALFEMLASCAVAEEGPLSPARPPADFDVVPEPSSLPEFRELMAGLDPMPLPAEWALRDYGLELRVVNAPWSPAGLSPDGGIRLWARADGPLPDDARLEPHHLHTAILAYHSDESLADNIALPWGPRGAAPAWSS